MKKISTQIMAGAMALSMIVTAASCSAPKKGGSSEPQTADKVISNAYKAVELGEEIPCKYVDKVAPLGDSGNVLVSGSDENGSVLYLTDYEFLTFTPIDMELPDEGNVESNFNVSVGYDGTIYALATVTDYGDFEIPDWDDENFDSENFDWEAYNEAGEASYYIYTIASDGSVTSKNEIKGIDKYQDEDGMGFYLGDFFICGDDLITIMNTDHEIYVPINVDGTLGDELDFGDNNYFYTRGNDKNGNLYFWTWEDDKTILRRIDAETLTIDNKNDIVLDEKTINNVNSITKGSGDYKLYISCSKSLFGIKEDNSTEELINWIDSDLSGDTISSIIPLEDGDFIVFENDWNADKNNLYRLTKRDVSELSNTTVINVAVEYSDSDFMSKVKEFNKTSDKYRIRIDDYSSYYEWDEESEKTKNTPVKQLMSDIAAGKSPDMIVFSDSLALINNLGKKGALADLYEFMGKNGTVAKEDITENILKGGEINGKLVALSPSYYVNTFAVKKKYFDGNTWTMDDMIEAFEKLPEGALPIQYCSSKSDLFGNLLSSGDFIDFANGTCNFNSPEFVKLLEFCNNDDFKEIDWENGDDDENQKFWNDQEAACRNDKALMSQMNISDPRDFSTQRSSNFNDEISLVGAPNSSGKSGLITPTQSFCIMDNSSNKDACWEFISEFFTKEYQESNNVYNIPSLKEAFEKKLDDAMEDPYYLDENGKKVTYDNTVWINDKEIKVENLTQEERDFIEEYILSATMKMFDYSSDAFSIVTEEAKAYFEGERSAEETVNIIQNRVSILISEQS